MSEYMFSPGLPIGYEFDYVEKTTSTTITATTDGNSQGTAIIDGNAIIFDGVTRIKVEFCAPYFFVQNASDNNGIINLYDGTTDLGRLINQETLNSSVANLEGVYVARFLTPSAGSHTFHIRGWKTASGLTVSLGAGAGGASAYMPAWYRVTKA